ncbi:unnamed protein product [Lupinus luteus]|uniref:DUF3741 domain-containing protein n=1 Tax=Lupinus luteus TaxID=3873 RepID=A0AAV1YGF0_LUPLU
MDGERGVDPCPEIQVSKEEFEAWCKPWKQALVVRLLGLKCGVESSSSFWSGCSSQQKDDNPKVAEAAGELPRCNDKELFGSWMLVKRNNFFPKNKGKVVESREGFNGTAKFGGKLQVPKNTNAKGPQILGDGPSCGTNNVSTSEHMDVKRGEGKKLQPLASVPRDVALKIMGLHPPSPDVGSNAKGPQMLGDGPSCGTNNVSTREHMDVQVPDLYFSYELCNVVQDGDDVRGEGKELQPLASVPRDVALTIMGLHPPSHDVGSNAKGPQILGDGPSCGTNNISTSEHMDVQVPGLYFSYELCNVVQDGDNGVAKVSHGAKGSFSSKLPI